MTSISVSQATDAQLIRRLSDQQEIFVLDNYDSTYAFLQENWNKVCSKLNTTPKKIILIGSIRKTSNEVDKTLKYVCDELVKRGYIIRQNVEFQPCFAGCGRTIVTEEMYEVMKNFWSFLPEEWNEKCSDCRMD